MKRLILFSLASSIFISLAFTTMLHAQEDEFKEFTDTDQQEEFQQGDDEFGEFDEFKESDDSGHCENHEECSQNNSKNNTGLYFIVGTLIFTVIAGFFVRFKWTRKLRLIFLLTSLVILGFYRGGCPCMISGFHDFWFWIFGQDVKFYKLLWFLGLIPITYLFGRVWCGWICHLGAFQEFIYKQNKIKFLKSDKFQKGLKIFQYIFFIVLVLQIIITKTNIFVHYDPFKVAFNLFSSNLLGYILLILLLLTSLFINRPFCRAICPVGLVLGWISKIPGALKIQKNIQCTSCHLCEKDCPTMAIDSNLNFNTEDCIACGKCFDSCKKDAICCERISTYEK